MKGLYTRGNYKFNKIPLQLIEVNTHVIHHLESNLYVSHVVINNHTIVVVTVRNIQTLIKIFISKKLTHS